MSSQDDSRRPFAAEQARGPLWHPEKFRAAPAHRSAFELALCRVLDLTPRRDHTGKRDGRRARMVALFDGKVQRDTIRQWCKGRRSAPQWAWDCLARASEAHRRHYQHSDDVIAAGRSKARL